MKESVNPLSVYVCVCVGGCGGVGAGRRGEVSLYHCNLHKPAFIQVPLGNHQVFSISMALYSLTCASSQAQPTAMG